MPVENVCKGEAHSKYTLEGEWRNLLSVTLKADVVVLPVEPGNNRPRLPIGATGGIRHVSLPCSELPRTLNSCQSWSRVKGKHLFHQEETHVESLVLL